MEPESTQQPAPVPKKPKIGLTLAIIFLAVLVLAGITLTLRSDKDTSSNQAKEVEVTRTADIAISKDGFTPATLQVNSGTQVTWTNNDDIGHQLQVGPDSKEALGDFNEEINLLKGETYSYNFTKPGTYHISDNQNPVKYQVTVIVQ